MTTGIAALLTLVFALLAALHLYWAFGGQWGLESVLPTRPGSSEVIFEAGRAATAAVALALTAAALLVAWRGDLIALPAPSWIPQVGIWVLAVVFLLRAIGDFRYVGLFKRVRDTRFGRMDTRLFSPLCLAISSLAFLLALVGG